jgi:hypothetical protein
MADVKRIVCLANSRKLAGRCVAGKEWAGDRAGVWIRPVSAREFEEVSEYERQYEDGSDPRVLDIMNVPLISAKPKSYQPENWLLDPNLYWEKQGRLAWSDVASLADAPAILWKNASNSTNGYHDRVLEIEAAQFGSSLYLIRVTDLKLKVFAPGTAFGNAKRRVQGRFSYRGTQYWLWVTDPIWERHYLAGSDGEFNVGE